MKKFLLSFLIVLLLLPLATACGAGYDYTVHISEARSDVFRAETDEFTVTVSCVSREHPYGADGVACPKSDTVEISLVPAQKPAEDYSILLESGGKSVGGEMSFRNAFGDWFFSQGVESFPEGSVSLTVRWGENARSLTATSVKTDKTLSVEDALGCAIKAEKDRIDRMTKGGAFLGEFHVRLLRRDKNYYYVGIVDTDGDVLSLLLDSETGEILARRDTKV